MVYGLHHLFILIWGMVDCFSYGLGFRVDLITVSILWWFYAMISSCGRREVTSSGWYIKAPWFQPTYHRCPFPIGWFINRGV